MDYDIIIIGAGPAGLSFARSFADTNLNILLIEKATLACIKAPEPDGREIALTHLSKKLLQGLGAWSHMPSDAITSIKKASVLNGDSSYSLNFSSNKNEEQALGFMVPNHIIRKSLYDSICEQSNVSIMAGESVEKVSVSQEQATVTLSNGSVECAKLLVSADSRFSETRRSMGISARMRDFSRVAIVCRMQHEKPHHDIATECFHYGRTLAVLPLSGNTSSIVITVSTSQAEQITNMDEKDFNQDIQHRFSSRLGTMKLIDKRFPYPLVAVHADRFVSNRYALIGDAAVGMHPVTAHGFNLGLRGQNTLANEIKVAIAANKDFTTAEVLKKYERKHMRVTRPMYHGTNGLVSLFTNDSIPAKALRGLALRVANKLPPIKQLITHSLTERDSSRIPWQSLSSK